MFHDLKNVTATDCHNMQKCIDSFINTRWSDKNDFKCTALKTVNHKNLQFSGILHPKKSEYKSFSVINKEIRYN